MGLDPAGPEVGRRADLLAIDAGSVREAVAGAHVARRVYRGGDLVVEVEATVRWR